MKVKISIAQWVGFWIPMKKPQTKTLRLLLTLSVFMTTACFITDSERLIPLWVAAVPKIAKSMNLIIIFMSYWRLMGVPLLILQVELIWEIWEKNIKFPLNTWKLTAKVWFEFLYCKRFCYWGWNFNYTVIFQAYLYNMFLFKPTVHAI